MITRLAWKVLIVDDEDDVHEITRLALKPEKIFDLPIKTLHAKSSKEAMELLSTETKALSQVCVALVDVVMETDTAGLDLCRYVREDLGDHSMQLIVRTGQPGVAPPRKVIDEYDISGYVGKPEVTKEKLYMIVKAGIQQFYNMRIFTDVARIDDKCRVGAKDAETAFAMYSKFLGGDFGEGGLNAGWDFGDRYVGTGYFKDKAVYDEALPGLMERAGPELRTREFAGVRNPCAWVDDFLIVEAPILRSNKTARLVVKNPTFPRKLFPLYASLWRRVISLWAETIA
ncbi:response regulator [Myxococcota bacterium]